LSSEVAWAAFSTLAPSAIDSVVRRWEVLDPKVEVDLLRRCPVGPVRRDVIGRELNADARLTVHDDHVPVIFGIHFTLEHPSPEAALGGEVRGVEHDDLMIDPHRMSLARDGDDRWSS
jgi:hypothetical protein